MNNRSTDEHPAALRIAVLIPVYNNGSLINDVVGEAARYCSDIVVVDDGSTDATKQVLSKISGIEVVSFDKNRGKGCALRAGFCRAREMGFTHVISMDGDGQHAAKDIPVFIEKIQSEPDSLWIGNRILPMSGDDAPLRSRFGRRFGNFWYRFNTGIALHDTQCGFRAYPLNAVESLKPRGNRYEYEQDILIKAAWRGIEVKEVDIHLKYLPQIRRISHFRPIRDFFRISLINARAGFLRVAFPVVTYHAPGNTLGEKVRSIVRYELKSHTTPQRAASSVAMGVFLGIFPIHGFQVVTLMGLAALLGLNRPLAFLGVCVSSPPFLPFLIIAAIAIGRIVLPSDLPIPAAPEAAQRALQGGAEFVVGSTILAVISALLIYLSLYPVFSKLYKSGLLRGKAGAS